MHLRNCDSTLVVASAVFGRVLPFGVVTYNADGTRRP